MKTIKLHELSQRPELYDTLAGTLENGGLVCVPCRGTYRILADFRDPKAVTLLMQSKRRTSSSPSLVFVNDVDSLSEITDDIDPSADRVARALWPGPLTILFRPSKSLPRKISKQVARANGHIGVRIPEDDLMQRLLSRFGGPVLVSSANKENRAGASSPAQVRKNFVSRVAFFVDAGDLTDAESSTVIDIEEGQVKIARDGAIDRELVLAAI